MNTYLVMEIKRMRQEKGMTQEQLADVLYVSRQVISFWEQGKRLPDASMLHKLACYFNISFDELLRLSAF